MPLRFSVLASGSSGNSSLLESGGFGVLLDAGLGPRQLEARLEEVSAFWQHIHAVLLTHIHGDHWNERTFFQLLRRGIPLYCHAEHDKFLAAESSAFADLRAGHLVRIYETEEELLLGPGLRCRPIPVRHDSGVTYGFRFEGPADFFGRTYALGYATDLGSWDTALARALGNVDLLALEFNHDVGLELSSGRSPDLIARVLGDHGHLSNEQAAALVQEVVNHSEPGRLQYLVQLHLSRECNRPALARAAAQNVLADRAVTVHSARQDRPGPCLALGMFRTWSRQPRTKARMASDGQQPCFPGWDAD